MVRVVRFEKLAPNNEVDEIISFIGEVFKKCDLATECDLGEGRIDRIVILKTFYHAVIKFYKKKHIYMVILDFKAKRAEIHTLAIIVEDTVSP